MKNSNKVDMLREDEKVKEAVKSQFGKNAEKYVTSETHAKGDDLSLMVEWLQPEPNWVVLDLATGGGHVTKAVAPHVAHVFATDLTQPMLETAQKHLQQYCGNAFYVVADAEELPFLNETFDAVACRIAAHHFPNPDKFVREVSRVLKPGGKFLLIDNIAAENSKLDTFVNHLEKARDESHVRSHSISGWMSWISQVPLTVHKSQIRRKTFQYPTWVRRTAKSESQVEQVTAFIKAADKEIHEYFAVVIQDDQIISLQVDEWMVLFEKQGKPNKS